ncbi:MAG: lytic transglycosylase domain-containing protein, partial [Albimonas sp.]|uniref:lytic transglycosylase domain-containing protein n=1 Tax=Albimonas sp. TaxID=1872425 RepID=UPI004055BF5C
MSTPLVDAVIWQESRGNPNAVNPRTGASGLMQVMPDTARDPGFGVQPLDWSQRFDRNENKRFGTDYLGAMLSRYQGDVDAALAAYNWGPGNADRWVSQGKPMDALPAETRDYITKIKGRMQMAQADSGTMSDAGGYRKVTDPDLLRRLEGGSGAPAGYRKVEDPETIAHLEGTATPKAAVPEGMVFDPERNMYIDTKAAAERAAEEGGTLQKVNEYGLQALRGVPFFGEYVDEGLGALDEAFGGKPGLVQERVRSTQAVTQERDPLGSMAAQIGGGLGAAVPAAVMAGPMIAAGAPASPLGAAAYGGGLGLLGGGIEGGISGYGEGNSGDRMEAAGDRAMSGGLLGGLLGAAAPLAARGVGNLASYVRGRPDTAAAARLGLSRESAQVLGEAMDADNYGGAVGRNLQRAGPDAMVADAGPSAGGLLDWTINRGGRGAVSARAAVEDAATQAGRGVDDALTATLGAP